MGAALTQNGKCPCCSICLYKYYRVSMVYQIIIIHNTYNGIYSAIYSIV